MVFCCHSALLHASRPATLHWHTNATQTSGFLRSLSGDALCTTLSVRIGGESGLRKAIQSAGKQFTLRVKMSTTASVKNASSKAGAGKGAKRGSGVAVVWFRNDLRVHDNDALRRAWQFSEAVLPVYCVDPRQFGRTHFGYPKTGELRAQFLLESIADLRSSLKEQGSDLYIRVGKPEEVLAAVVKATGAHTVFAQKETCSEELQVEVGVQRALAKIELVVDQSKGLRARNPTLELLWGTTMYHIEDLPFVPGKLPDVYTQFRKAVETSSKVRPPVQMPTSLGPLPQNVVDKLGNAGPLPTLAELGLSLKEQSPLGVMRFVGGEKAALARIQDYFWTKDLLRVYKETRNGMLGADYSTKFSPWLAVGALSPRFIHAEVKRYESERVANESTYWVLFELIWRDYFRFLSLKYGNAIFFLGGPRRIVGKSWSQDARLFEAWRDGRTGYPLIDANMKELSATGFMSNRGRQIVCSFMVRDMGLDWRMGAEWFETCLLDYDPCSNYGNWTYGAGVGNDPREDRYFSIPKQAQNYDPDGEYVAHWLPELRRLPKSSRHNPGQAYISPIVPLKVPNAGRGSFNSSSSGVGGGRGSRGRGSGGPQQNTAGRGGMGRRF